MVHVIAGEVPFFDSPRILTTCVVSRVSRHVDVLSLNFTLGICAIDWDARIPINRTRKPRA
jgi:hypothetical protein